MLSIKIPLITVGINIGSIFWALMTEAIEKIKWLNIEDMHSNNIKFKGSILLANWTNKSTFKFIKSINNALIKIITNVDCISEI